MVEKKEKRDPSEATKEAHQIYLGPAKFLVSKLGLAKQAGVELDVDRCSVMGSQAELTFGSLLYQFMMSITEEVGRLGLISDVERLNRLSLPERAKIFCDENCAQKLVDAGYSYEFGVLIAQKLGVVVPVNPVEVVGFESLLGGVEGAAGEEVAGEVPAGPIAVIGTTYVRVVDVFSAVEGVRDMGVEGADGGMELTDTRPGRGGTDRFGAVGGGGAVGRSPSEIMGTAPTEVYSVGAAPLEDVLDGSTGGGATASGVTAESRDKPSRISLPLFLRRISLPRPIAQLLKALRERFLKR